jgi:hypothetical protein
MPRPSPQLTLVDVRPNPVRSQIPATASISAFLSGGAEACYGSQEFDLCLQAFVSQNPPGASPEGQLRSLVTTMVSRWNQVFP